MSVVLWCPCATGESDLYDNPARQKQRKRPQRVGEDEDIYGGVGEGEEGVYDTVGGDRTMKLSEDGIYEAMPPGHSTRWWFGAVVCRTLLLL